MREERRRRRRRVIILFILSVAVAVVAGLNLLWLFELLVGDLVEKKK